MLFKQVFFLMLIVSHLGAEPSDDEKANCNLIASPLGYQKEDDSNEKDEKFCISGNPSATEYRCCYQSYRIISSMTTSCKLIEKDNEHKFKEAKQLLKDNNAKNITIDCMGRITQNAISTLFLFFFFLF